MATTGTKSRRLARSSAATSSTRTASSRAAAATRADRGRNGSVSSERQASFTAPGLSAKDGKKVVEVLQGRLCSLVDLGLTLKHIHWNVVGPSFIGVHRMLDPQYEGVSGMVDELAERVATMGGVPSGLPGRIVETRSWDDYGLGRADTQAHLAALDLVYVGVISEHRQAMKTVGEIDPISEDLLIGQTGVLEQYHWFVRTHLEDWAGGLANAGATHETDAARSVMTKARRSPAGRAARAG